MRASLKHLLTFDVEHWYEGYRYRNLEGWEGLPPRDHIIVEQLFELLNEHEQMATFFFTGRFAREFPDLVRKCVIYGHEVASHSEEHGVIYRMSGKEEFRRDLRASLDVLTSLTGQRVLGYRAPKWSVTKENQGWALDILAEEGLIYDSSFFPSFGADITRRQGLPLQINLATGRSIIEIPATGLNVGSITVPVAGGLYFRALPGWMTSAMLAQKERHDTRGMLYVHPYDLDAQSPKIPDGNFLFRLSRNFGVTVAWKKLEQLLITKRFTSIAQWLPTLTDIPKIDCT